MTVQRFSRSALPAMPWKNGGGTTQEIVCWPPGAGLDDFDWRASIASIAASGPFSVFAGVERTIMLLDGRGVRLQAEGFDHLLDAPCQPFVFGGEDRVDCSLLDGVSTDFNLMVRRAAGRAELRVLAELTQLERCQHGLLMSLDGQWRVGGGMLKQGQGVWWADQKEAWIAKPASRGALLLAVLWWPAEGAPALDDLHI